MTDNEINLLDPKEGMKIKLALIQWFRSQNIGPPYAIALMAQLVGESVALYSDDNKDRRKMLKKLVQLIKYSAKS